MKICINYKYNKLTFLFLSYTIKKYHITAIKAQNISFQ